METFGLMGPTAWAAGGGGGPDGLTERRGGGGGIEAARLSEGGSGRAELGATEACAWLSGSFFSAGSFEDIRRAA